MGFLGLFPKDAAGSLCRSCYSPHGQNCVVLSPPFYENKGTVVISLVFCILSPWRESGEERKRLDQTGERPQAAGEYLLKYLLKTLGVLYLILPFIQQEVEAGHLLRVTGLASSLEV